GFDRRYIIGGLISFACYLIVLFSYQHMPVPVVSAIRETSIIFAVILGAIFLKEKIFWEKIGLVATVLCGLLVLNPF
ncbi:MAG: EamA family transporter, partial [Candidatus Nanopelagicales bacterium]